MRLIKPMKMKIEAQKLNFLAIFECFFALAKSPDSISSSALNELWRAGML